MKRLGIFTGRIYNQDDFEAGCIRECCRVITDEEAESIPVVMAVYAQEHLHCVGCFGCPESQR